MADKTVVAKTHWKSGLMAINPRKLEEHTGTIVAATGEVTGNTKDQLCLTIKRNKDSLEQKIIFCYFDVMGEDDEPSTQKTPDCVLEIYGDFMVSHYSELVYSPVVGVYFADHLVGIQKVCH